MPGKRKRDSQGGGGPAKKGKGDVGGAKQGVSASKSPGSSKGQRQQAPSTSATGPVTFPSSPTWWKENLPKNHSKWSIYFRRVSYFCRRIICYHHRANTTGGCMSPQLKCLKYSVFSGYVLDSMQG